MTFGTVIEIILAIFTVFGFYYAFKMLIWVLVYSKNIRKSVVIAVEISDSDDKETKELKQMCAGQLSRDLFGRAEFIIIEKDKD